MTSSKDISLLLKSAKEGSDDARDSLFVELHGQLRSHAARLMGNERTDHTLQATALVNEACLKILREGVVDSAENRRQLFHAAVRAMRQVLIDHARARASQKRGGEMKRNALDFVFDNFEAKHEVSFLDLDAALERLKDESARGYEVLTLRFFAGLTITETATILECSESTVEADWRFARARLMMWLK